MAKRNLQPMTILSQPKFNGFGPSFLIPQTRGRIRRHELPTDRLEGRKLLREKCPETPGVYGWLNRDGQLIYVGKSRAYFKTIKIDQTIIV